MLKHAQRDRVIPPPPLEPTTDAAQPGSSRPMVHLPPELDPDVNDAAGGSGRGAAFSRLSDMAGHRRCAQIEVSRMGCRASTVDVPAV